MVNEYIKIIVNKTGGITRLANLLRIKHPSIHNWKHVPARHVLRIEELTGISRHELHPDIFGPPPANDNKEEDETHV